MQMQSTKGRSKRNKASSRAVSEKDIAEPVNMFDSADEDSYDCLEASIRDLPSILTAGADSKLPRISPRIYSKFRRERMYRGLADIKSKRREMKQSEGPSVQPIYAWGEGELAETGATGPAGGDSESEGEGSISAQDGASPSRYAMLDSHEGLVLSQRTSESAKEILLESPTRVTACPSVSSSLHGSPSVLSLSPGSGDPSPGDGGHSMRPLQTTPFLEGEKGENGSHHDIRPTLATPRGAAASVTDASISSGSTANPMRRKKKKKSNIPSSPTGGMFFSFPTMPSMLGQLQLSPPSPVSSSSPNLVDFVGGVNGSPEMQQYQQQHEEGLLDQHQLQPPVSRGIPKAVGKKGYEKKLDFKTSFSNAIDEHDADETDKAMHLKLHKIHDKLLQVNKETSNARMNLLANADSIVSGLPLKYLYQKPELRHYAFDRALRPIIKLATKKIHEALKRAFDFWRQPPPITELDERQIGLLVIVEFLGHMLEPIYQKAFTHWAKLYSSRFQKDQDIGKNAASSQIAEWYRHVRVTRKKVFQVFSDAVKVCLDRRKAIKHTIVFEQTRRSSLLKFLRAITKRRRHYFGARSIMRPYLWFKLYRKVQTRLTRKVFARQLQRWFRMTRYRPDKERYLIGKILYFGGYSVVYPKIPEDLLRRNGFLNGFDQCASVIQRAWFVSKGAFAAFMVAAARRAKEEYEQMRNDNALIIQSNFRGHLWNLLNLAAKQWNKARRISFAFRHYQYRCWVAVCLANAKHRPARIIQRWIRNAWWLRTLPPRFLARKCLFIWQNLKQTYGAFAIQSAWKHHLERERIKLEEFKAWVALQRANSERVARMVVKIQQNWRQMLKSGNRFPRHVYLVMWRKVRQRRKKEYLAAMVIQKVARPYIKQQIELEREGRIAAANIIWGIAKCYNLKLAMFDRVEATKLRKKIASNFLKRNFRVMLLNRHIRIRCILRQHQKKHAQLVYDGATYIQRWVKRKFAEYYIPVRSAARLEVAKKAKRDEARRILARKQKAAAFIIRIFQYCLPDKHNQMLIERERDRILRIRKTRVIAKFARRIIAWARFDKIAAYRIKVSQEYESHYRLRHAANVVGYYWKRKHEKLELWSRFVHRKAVLAEYRRLEALKVEAYRQRDEAIEDKRRTDENMRATINASWKQGSDVSGKNYYYNYVTGESQWDPPEGWVVPKAHKKWLRQMDERANVYYYNMETQESSWLPPCNICGDASEKHCQNCEAAYCDRCFDEFHRLDDPDDPDDEEQSELRLHAWSLVEYEKDILKPGEIYCIECKRRNANRMCLQCWDAYCDVCFRYTHHTGNLKYHKSMPYKKAKHGWMCVKAKSAGDSDYYVKGDTGQTTYEKPWELMTENEQRLYNDFLSHQKAATEHIETIRNLQIKLEEASFERDSILADAMNAGFMGGSVVQALKKKKTKKQLEQEELEAEASLDVVAEVEKNIKPSMFSWLGMGSTTEYQSKILKPKERERGSQKSEYMAQLITKINEDTKKEKEAARNLALRGG